MENPSSSTSSSSTRTTLPATSPLNQQQQQVSDTQINSMVSKLNSTMTTSKYVRDFESLFVPIDKDKLRNKAQSGNLRHCQFRSLCWRYFLHCLPEQYNNWLNVCCESRKRYENICLKHLSTIKQANVPKQQTTSISTTDNNEEQYKFANDKPMKTISDEEQAYIKASNECNYRNIYKTIERDVVRTFPDMEFFRQTEMQEILGNILFNFASENPHLSYKQGMHELLATLLYVAHTDSQNCLINYEGDYANEAIATLLDLKYLEHDVFHLFSALMKSIESWYQNDEILMIPIEPTSSNRSRLSSSLSSRQQQQVSSVLGLKLKKISENIVRKYDIELFNHLEALQIAPQIYGIRWMRLLFSREYEFLDLLTVWDAIICDQNTMSLVDYVFASMLMTIREKLINGDYTDCLNNLMRHQFVDVPYVIRLALHLRDPINNARPKAHRHSYNSIQHTNINSNNRLRQQQQQPAAVAARLSSSLHQNSSSRNSQSSSSSRNTQSKLNHHQDYSSHPRDLILSLGQRVKDYEMKEILSINKGKQFIQSTSASIIAGKPNVAAATTTNARREGYQLMSPSASLDTSNESYEDLHSIVDYCWRLLSEQIDSLQRCLPKEKSLSSEDEIFVALAQLKKVRDVLKGSLRLEDELETSSVAGPLSKNINI